jgi:hypothetical protein
VWGVRGEPARYKARTNNRAWPASADPPQKIKAGQDRASTVGCVKADIDIGRAQRRPSKNKSAGLDKGHDRCETEWAKKRGRCGGKDMRCGKANHQNNN